MGTPSPTGEFCKNTRKRKLIDPMSHSNNASVYRSILLTIKSGDGAEENEPENHGRVHWTHPLINTATQQNNQ